MVGMDLVEGAACRQGREQVRHWLGQVYIDGIRQVAGVVPILTTETKEKHIVLITSRKRPGEWILPKGGWESDETPEESAIREAYEEAGLRGHTTRELGLFDHTKHRPVPATEVDDDEESGATNRKVKPVAQLRFFEMSIRSLEEDWPERHQRQRRVCTYETALEVVANPIMRRALLLCSLASQTSPDSDNTASILESTDPQSSSK
ncbi:hypothetical protein HK102_010003 [Quaeritorhiza haematococci]|nr:hypothetical protein HK102_010003 [Quaeritorhiza haematococci]